MELSFQPFYNKAEELAQDMSFDEFLAIVLLEHQDGSKIIGFKEYKGVKFFHNYCYGEERINLVVVLPPDVTITEDEIEELYPDYEYSIYAFDKDKGRMLGYLYHYKISEVSPLLRERKRLTDIQLRPLDLKCIAECARSKFEVFDTAERLISYYDFCCENDLREYFIYCHRHDDVKKLTIEDVDSIRGKKREQDILSRIVHWECQGGVPVVLELWDMDEGFETLADGVLELLESGQVKMELTRYEKDVAEK